jgi:hypothetical protein
MDFQRLWRGIAVFLTVCTAIAWFMTTRMEWRESADFDIIGFMWVAMNLPKLCAWLAVFFLGALAIASWWKSFSESD